MKAKQKLEFVKNARDVCHLKKTSMDILKEKYQKEALPKLKEEFGLKNDLSCPTLEKIVLNMGLADALTNKDVIVSAKSQLAQIAGQIPKVTCAKAAISNFKLRAGDPIGVMVTLRGKRAWSFLTKLASIVLPRMRDFRGLDSSKFDKFGNYNLGLEEQILFPQIDYSKIDKIRGLVVSIVFANSSPEKSKKLMELLGFPFRKEASRSVGA